MHKCSINNLWTSEGQKLYPQTMVSASIFEYAYHESHSGVSDSLQPHELCSAWNSPGQNTGMGSCSLHQGIFPTQGSNSGLSHCRRTLPAEPQGSPKYHEEACNSDTPVQNLITSSFPCPQSSFPTPETIPFLYLWNIQTPPFGEADLRFILPFSCLAALWITPFSAAHLGASTFDLLSF